MDRTMGIAVAVDIAAGRKASSCGSDCDFGFGLNFGSTKQVLIRRVALGIGFRLFSFGRDLEADHCGNSDLNGPIDIQRL